MSLSLSESAGQDTRGDEQEEGWKSDFEVDFKSDFTLDDTAVDGLTIPGETDYRMDKPHEDNAETRESLTKGEREGLNPGNQDGESDGGLLVVEGVEMGEDEEHEDQATLSDNGSKDDGASVIAAELTEVATWEAKVALFLETRLESTEEEVEEEEKEEASEPPAREGSIVARGASVDEEVPMSTESAGVISEEPPVATMDDETLPSKADTINTTIKPAAAESMERTMDAGRDDGQPIASDGLMDAGPEIELEQPDPAVEALAEDGAAVPAADLGAVGEASASDAMPTPAESAGVDAMLPAVEALNELDDSTTVLEDPSTEFTASPKGAASSKGSPQVVESGDVQPAVGDAVVEAGPDINPKKPVLLTDPTVEDIEMMSPANLDVASEASADDAVPTSAESARVPADQPAFEAAPEIESGDTIPVGVDPATSASDVHQATSLENGKGVELGENQPRSVGADELMEVAVAAAIPESSSRDLVVTDTAGSSMLQNIESAAGDALIDMGPETEVEQIVPAVEVLVEGDGVVVVVDPDVLRQEANAAGESPTSAESAQAVAGQPAEEEMNELGRGETAAMEFGTTTPAVSVNPAVSLDSSRVADLDEVQPAADDALVDAGSEAEPEELAPPAEALAEEGAAVPAADPDATGEASINDVIPMPAESAGVPNEQPTVERANEPGRGNTAPDEANAEYGVAIVDIAGSTETTQVVEPDEMESIASGALVDTGPETETEQPVPATEELVDGDAMVVGADPSVTEGVNAGEEIPMSAESVEVDVEQPEAEAAPEPASGETASVEADTTTSDTGTNPAASFKIAKAAEIDEVQRGAGDALIEAGPENELEEPAPTAEGDEVMPAADSVAAGRINAGEAIPTPPESAEMDVKQPRAHGHTSDEPTTPVADTSTPAVSLDPATSLEIPTVADGGAVQPAPGNAEIDPGRQAEAEQPAPAVEAQAVVNEVVLASGPGAAERVNTAEAVPTPGEPVGVDVEQPAFGPVNELAGEETISPVISTATPGDSIYPAASLDSARAANNGDTQPFAAGDAEINAGNEVEVGQPPLAAKALVKDGAAVPASDLDAFKETSINDVMPTPPESAGGDTEKLADEAANKPGSGETDPADASTESVKQIADTAAPKETSQIVRTDGMQSTAGDAPVDADPETTAEPPVPAAEAVVDGDGVVLATEPGADKEDGNGVVLAADPHAVKEGATRAESNPMSAGSAGVDDGQPSVKAANELCADETSDAAAGTMRSVINTVIAGSLDSARAAEYGKGQPTAVEELVDADPKHEAGQSAPSAKALTEGGSMVPAVEPTASIEGADAVEIVSTPAEPTRLDAEQPTVRADADNALTEAVMVSSAVDRGVGGSVESAQVVKPGETQPTPGDVIVNTGPEADPEQPVPVETEEGGAMTPTTDPDSVRMAKASKVTYTTTESAVVEAVQLLSEAANELEVGDEAFREVDTAPSAINVDALGSLESAKTADLDGVLIGTGDAVVDAGPETKAEQPVSAAEDQMEGGAAVRAVDSDTVGEERTTDVMPTSAEAREVHGEQPALGANNDGKINHVSTGDTAFAEAKSESTIFQSDAPEPLESACEVKSDTIHPTAGGVAVDADPETRSEPEQPLLAAEVMTGDDAVVPAASPDAVGEASTDDVMPTSVEAVEVDAEQPVIEATNELSSEDITPAETGTEPPVGSVDTDELLERAHKVEPGEIQPAASDVADPGADAEPEQSVLAAEAVAEEDGVVPAVDSDVVREVSTHNVMPTSTEAVEVDAERPMVEATHELRSDVMTAPETDITSPTPSLYPTESSERAHEVEPGEIHPAAGDASMDADPETRSEPEQPNLAAEAVAGEDGAVPATGQDAFEEARISDIMPTSTEALGVNADQPVVEATNELSSGRVAPAETDTTPPVGSMDTYESLDLTHEVDPGEIHPAAGDASIDANPETRSEPEQPILAAEAVAGEDGRVPAAGRDAVGEVSVSDIMPTSTEALEVGAEQLVVEATNELSSGAMAPAETDTAPPVGRMDAHESLERAHEVDPGEIHPAASDVADPETRSEPEQPVLAAEAMAEEDAAVSAAEPDDVGEASTDDVMPMCTEAVEVDAEQALVEEITGIKRGESTPADTDTTPPTPGLYPTESSEGTHEVEPGEIHPASGDASIDANPETRSHPQQPVLAAEAVAEEDGAVSAAGPGAVGEASTDDVMPTSAEAVEVDAEQPVVGAMSEPSNGDMTPAEADETPPVGSVDTHESSECAHEVESDTIHPTIGGVAVDADPEADAEPEQPVLAADAAAEDDGAVPAASPDAVGEARISDTIPTSAEALGVDAELPVVEATSELHSGLVAPPETDTTPPVDSVYTDESFECAHQMATGETRPAASDVADPEADAEPEQPARAADAVAEEDDAVPVADSDVVGEASTDDVMPISTEAVEVDAEQPVVEAKKEMERGESFPPETDITPSEHSLYTTEPSERAHEMEPGEIHPAAGDASIDADPETRSEPEQPVLAAEAVAGDDAAVPTASPDAFGEASTDDVMPTSAEAVEVDAELPVVEAMNELSSEDMTPAETDTKPPVGSMDTDELFKRAHEMEPGGIQPAASDLADPEAEAEPEQPVLTAEAVVGEDAAVPAAEPDIVGEANTGNVMPTSAEAVDVDAERPVVEVTTETERGESAPAETDTAPPTPCPCPTEPSERVHEPGEIHPTAGDASIDADLETRPEPEQPALAAEAVAEEDWAVPAAGPGAVGEASTDGVTPTSAEAVEVDAAHPGVEATNELRSERVTRAPTDTTPPVGRVNTHESLERAQEVEPGEIHPTAGDVAVDADPETRSEPAQPVLAAEAMAEEDGAVPAASPDAVGEARISDTIPTSAEALGVAAEQPVVEATHEPRSRRVSPPETDTTPPEGRVDMHDSLERAHDPEADAEPEQPVLTAEAAAEEDAVVPAAGPNSMGEASTDNVMPTSAEAVDVDAERPVVEGTHELRSGHVTPPETDTTLLVGSVGTHESLESAQKVEPGEIHPSAGVASIDADPETGFEPEQPVLAAEAAVGKDREMPAAEPDDVGEASTDDVMPTSAEAVDVDAEHPAAGATNELSSGAVAPPETDTKPPVVSVDTDESLEHAHEMDAGKIRPAVSDVTDPETRSEPEQPNLAAEAVAEEDGAVPAAEPDDVEEASTDDVMPTSAEAVDVDAERLVVEATKETGRGESTPPETDTTPPTPSLYPTEPSERAHEMEPGEIHAASGKASIDADPETRSEPEQPNLAAEAVTGDDAAVSAADPDAFGEASTDDVMPTSAVEARNELSSGDMTPAETDNSPPVGSIDTHESLGRAYEMEPGEIQPAASDVADPEADAEPEQPVLTAEAVAEEDAVVPAAGPNSMGEASTDNVMPTSAEAVDVDAERPVVEATHELRSGHVTPPETDTTLLVGGMDTHESLESAQKVEPGEIHPSAGGASIDADPKTGFETEQPVLAAEAVAEGEHGAVPAAGPDDVGEASTDDVMPTSAEAVDVDAELPVVEATNELSSGAMAPPETDTKPPVVSVDTDESLEHAHEMDAGKIHSAVSDVTDPETRSEPEQPVLAAEAVADEGGAVPAAEPDDAGEASTDDVMPTSAEAVDVDAERLVVEVGKELDINDKPQAEAETKTPAVSEDPHKPSDSAHEVEPGEIHPTAGDAVFEAKQPNQSAEALAGGAAVPAADIDATEELSAGEPVRMAPGSTGVDAKQPVIDARNELYGVPPAEAEILTPASNADLSTSLESGNSVEFVGNQPPSVGVDEMMEVVEAAAVTPEDLATRAVVTENAIGLPVERSVGGAADKALVDASPEAAAEPGAPTAEALAEGDGVRPVVDSGAAEGAITGEAIPTVVMSEGARAEPPAIEAANELTVDETPAAEPDIMTLAVRADSAAALKSAKVTELGNVQPTASDVYVNPGPETVEQAVPAAKALTDGEEVVQAADPDVVHTYTCEAIPMTAESAGVDTEQLTVETANESGSGGTAPAEANTTTSSVSNDTATPLESTNLAELGDVQPATGGALIGACRETEAEPERPVPTAEALPEDDAAGSKADPDASERANAGAAIPTSAEAAGVDVEHLVVEAVGELGSGDTARTEIDTNRAAIKAGTSGSLESTHEVESDDVPHATSDVDAGPGTEAEQPFVAAETLVDGDGVVPPADPDSAEPASAGDVVSASAESELVSAEQPAIEAANELESTDRTVEVDTTTSASNIDLPTTSSERRKIAEPGETQPPSVGVDQQNGEEAAATTPEDPSPNRVATDATGSPIEQVVWGAAGDAVIGADPETESEQPASAAGPLAGGDMLVLVADPDAVEEGAKTAEIVPSSAESADAEQPAVEAANEHTVDETAAPEEAGTMPSAISVDPAKSSESAKVVEHGAGYPAVDDTLVDADHETETGQPVPAAKAFAEGDAAAPEADPDAAKEVKEGATTAGPIPASTEAAGVDTEKLADEATHEPESGETHLTDASTESARAVADTAASTENVQVVETDEMQPTAGDPEINAGPEAEAEQPAPAVEAEAEGDRVVPAAESDAAEGANTAEEIPTANVSAGGNAEQPAGEAANEPGGGDSAPAESDSIDPVEVDDIESATGDVVIDAGPEPEAKQSALVAEALEDPVGAVPVADPGDTEGPSAGEAIPLANVSAGVNAEQSAVEAANEISSGDMAPVEVDTEATAVVTGTATSLESPQVERLGETQPTSGDVILNDGPETNPEQPVVSVETDGGAMTPTADPDTAGTANAGDALISATESVEVEVVQPIGEAANELGAGDAALTQADTAPSVINIDTPRSLESPKTADLDGVQIATDDAVVDAGPETEAEYVSAAEDPVEDVEVVMPADSDTANEANTVDAVESAQISAKQPTVEGGKELGSGDRPSADANISTSASDVVLLTSSETGKVVELGKNQLPSVGVDELMGVESAAANPENIPSNAVVTDTPSLPTEQIVEGAPGIVTIDADPEAVEQSVPAANAQGERDVVEPAVDPDYTKEEAGINDMVPMPAESAGVVAEQPEIEPANEPSSDDTAPADATMASVVAIVDTTGSTGTAQVVDPGALKPTAGDGLVDACLVAETEQPPPVVEAQVDGGGVVLATSLCDGADAAEAIPTANVPAGAEQQVVEAVDEPSSGDASQVERDNTIPAVGVETHETVDRLTVADLQSAAGDTVVDAGPEAEAEQTAPAAEAEGVVLAVGSGAPDGANAAEEIPRCTESVELNAEQRAFVAANGPGCEKIAPAVADTVTPTASIDPASSLESTRVADHGDVQPDADDVPVDAGPRASPEEPAPAAEALTGERAGPAADLDATGEAGINNVMPPPAESAGVHTEQPAVAPANEPGGGNTAVEDASTESVVDIVHSAASLAIAEVSECGKMQPAAGDALVGAGPETEAEQSVPPTEELADGDRVVLGTDPDVAGERADAAEEIPTSAESLAEDAKQPTVEAANEPGSSQTAPVEANTTTPAVSVDPVASLDRSRVANLDEVQPAADAVSIDAGPEAAPKELAPPAEALAEEGAAVPAADPVATREASTNDMMPTPAESAGVTNEQPTVERASEPGSGNSAPGEATAESVMAIVDTAGSTDTAQVVEPDEMKPTASVALVDTCPETETEQPVPATEELVDGDAMVLGADPSDTEEVNAGKEIPTSADSGEVDVEQSEAEAAPEPASGKTASVEADTTTSDTGTNPAASLESAKVAQLDEVQRTAGDALIEAGPETEAEPAPAAKILVESGAVTRAVDSDAAKEGSDAAKASPASAGVDAEQPGVTGDGDTVPAEADKVATSVRSDAAGSIESAHQVAERCELQAAACDAMVDAGPGTELEKLAPAAEASVVEPGTANEEANVDEAIRTSAESARLSAEPASLKAANELGSGTMAPAKVDNTTPALTYDARGSLDAANALKGSVSSERAES
eukprot:g8047.t1